MHELISRALNRAARGEGPDVPLLELIVAELPGNLPHLAADLMAVARLLASHNRKTPFACGILNAKSGRCAENCAFCAQSGHHATSVLEYPLLSIDRFRRRAAELAEQGAAYMGIVCSGTAPGERDFARLCEVAARIKSEYGIKLCASLGVLDAAQAVALKQAGFSSYHHNLETAASFYSQICTTHEYTARLDTVRHALDAGLRVCSGGIFGLGETWAQRLELALTLRELKVHSVPVNFLTPVPGTPLADKPSLPPAEALAVVALLRLALP